MEIGHAPLLCICLIFLLRCSARKTPCSGSMPSYFHRRSHSKQRRLTFGSAILSNENNNKFCMKNKKGKQWKSIASKRRKRSLENNNGGPNASEQVNNIDAFGWRGRQSDAALLERSPKKRFRFLKFETRLKRRWRRGYWTSPGYS